MKTDHREMLNFHTDPSALIDALEQWQPPTVNKWIGGCTQSPTGLKVFGAWRCCSQGGFALHGRRLKPNKRSVVPEARYPAKGITVECHPANGGERQVSSYEQLSAGSRLL